MEKHNNKCVSEVKKSTLGKFFMFLGLCLLVLVVACAIDTFAMCDENFFKEFDDGVYGEDIDCVKCMTCDQYSEMITKASSITIDTGSYYSSCSFSTQIILYGIFGLFFVIVILLAVKIFRGKKK